MKSKFYLPKIAAALLALLFFSLPNLNAQDCPANGCEVKECSASAVLNILDVYTSMSFRNDITNLRHWMIFTNDAGTLRMNCDGTATLTGTLYHSSNSDSLDVFPCESGLWEVNVNMVNRQNYDDWTAGGGSYYHRCDSTSMVQLDYDYYELGEAVITGTSECNMGEKIILTIKPEDGTIAWQVGDGAHNVDDPDCSYSIGGWYYYTTCGPTAEAVFGAAGRGDLHVDLDNCTESVQSPDTDGDGVCDADDICLGGDDSADADGDGVPDYCDVDNDSDGDGVVDIKDVCEGGDDNQDEDCNGVPDDCESKSMVTQCDLNPYDTDAFALGYWFYDEDGVKLPTKFFNFDAAGGKLTQYDDGTANYSGTIVNTEDPNDQYYFCMNFKNKMNWTEWSAIGRDYKLKEACNGDEYLYWDFYEIDGSNSFVRGLGINDSIEYVISHYPTNNENGVQVGYGGHNSAPNCEYSIGAWFDLTINGEKVGKGDIHSILDNCNIQPCSVAGPDDSDGDGVCDSRDVCDGGDDLQDFDCDGIPDDCEEGSIIQQCSLNPLAPGSFNLGFHFDVGQNAPYNWSYYNFDENGGTFTQFSDGSANYQGNIVNTADSTDTWKICVNMKFKRNWAQWSELGREAVIQGNACTGDEYLYWDYFEINPSTSFLLGYGENSGTDYEIGHYPADHTHGAQVGIMGQNNNNYCDYGIGAWWTLLENGEVVGKGDIHSYFDNCDFSYCTPMGDGDSDMDGVCDFKDVCEGQDDTQDYDCDGIPNLCEQNAIDQRCDLMPFEVGEFALGFHFDVGTTPPYNWQMYNFDADGGKLTQYSDGTANYQGTIVNLDDPTDSWEFKVNFINKRNWTEWSALGRDYKAQGATCGGSEYEFFDFYEINANTSTLVGLGDNAGATMTLTHFPVDYNYGAQVGYGAHNSAPNCNFSIGAWFGIELNGVLVGKGDIHSSLNCEFSVVDIDVILQGPANDSLFLNDIEADLGGGKAPEVYGNWMMKDLLRYEGLIPNEQPYGNLAEFNYNGTEAATDDVLAVTGRNAIVDWILVEVRDAADAANIIETRAALLQRDGDVVDVDGHSTLPFDLPPGEYHIAVRHRNHLGLMTANTVTIGGGTTHVDFTDPSTECYGQNACIALDDNTMALWAGTPQGSRDIIFQGAQNGLNEIFFDIMTASENGDYQINYILNEYTKSDLDMNCQAIYQGSSNDGNIIFFNVLTHPDNNDFSTNFIIQEQLPE